MNSAGAQRVTRLVSAGVPTTDAFQAVVEEIIDNGPADFDTLNKRVQSAMFLKEKRILSDGFWRTWDDFTRDILDQISGVDEFAVPTLSLIQGKWSVIEFTKGKSYLAIPKADITYTVWDEETRLKRDIDARKQMDLRSAKSGLNTLLDRYDWGSDRTQLLNAIGRLNTLERRLNGVEVEDEDETPRKVRAPQPKPSIVRGDAEWQRITGCKMRFPVKDLTIEITTAKPSGEVFTLPEMTALVSTRVADIEKGLVDLNPVVSGTVLQALQGKANGPGGLVADRVIERLETGRLATFRRL